MASVAGMTAVTTGATIAATAVTTGETAAIDRLKWCPQRERGRQPHVDAP